MKKNNKNKTLSFVKYFPFLSWWEKLKNPQVVKSDIVAWISVALVLIPQSMAYASLAGLPIEVGLYTALIPVIVAAIFWSCSQMSTGPITIISLMTAAVLAPIAVTGTQEYIALASLLAFFTWIFYLILSSLKLWMIVDFLSHPVILGFTNGVCILTILSQLGKIFWVSIDKWENFFEYIFNIFSAVLLGFNFPTFLVGIWSILLLVLLAKYFPKLPKVLILLVISIWLSYYFWFEENYWWSIVHQIPNHFPTFWLPFLQESIFNLSIDQLGKIILYSMIIWLIAFTQTIWVAKFVWYKTKQKISANKELIGQGLANISSSFFWGYWVAGSFSKTAVNIRNGAQTWLSSVITGVWVILTLLFLTPLLYHLPMASLSAVIVVAVIWLIKFQPMLDAWKVEKHDAIIAGWTFILTLILSPNLERAILIWVVVSLALYIYRTMRPKIVEVSMYKDWEYRDCELFGLKTSKCVSIVRVDWDVYFANSWYFEDEILNLVTEKPQLKAIIFDFEWMNNIDSSGSQMLTNLTSRLKSMWIKLYITNMRVRVYEKLKTIWFVKDFWENHFYNEINHAIESVIEKFWKKSDIKMLLEYKKDKNKKPELKKKLRKNYV